MTSPTPPQSDLDPSTDHARDGTDDRAAPPVGDPAPADTVRADAVAAAAGTAADSTEDADEFDDEFEDDDEPVLVADTAAAPAAAGGPTIVRRIVSAVLATVVFEVLYAIAIGLVAFFSAGIAAVGPTLSSAIGTPFAWAPAVVFLVVFAVLAIVRLGGRRRLAIGTLIAAVVVYLGSTLVVLLVAGGWAATSVYTQELGVYPFFLTGIVAREILFWTHTSRVRSGDAAVPSRAA
jgi:hypothetical protein